MAAVILLDAGPLGMVANPTATPANLQCNLWLEALLARQFRVCVPEIADYEVRRELLRAGRTASVRHLDRLQRTLDYLPLSTEAMRRAAAYWAAARQQGRPLADPHALDCDVILAAQAELIKRTGDQSIVATTNVGHLALFADARPWQTIT